MSWLAMDLVDAEETLPSMDLREQARVAGVPLVLISPNLNPTLTRREAGSRGAQVRDYECESPSSSFRYCYCSRPWGCLSGVHVAIRNQR